MKSVLVTGASTGIGRATTRYLDKHGYFVFAGVRKESDLESIQRESSINVKPIILDVSSCNNINNAVTTVKNATNKHGLFAIVNNAGITTIGSLETSELGDYKKVFDVNLFGMVAITKSFLPLLRNFQERNTRKICHIINISSIAGLQGYPLFSAYNSSKFAVKGFSEALRLELFSSGINVSVIEAGAIATEIWNKSSDEILALKSKLKSSNHSDHYLNALDKTETLLTKAQSKAASPDIVAELIHKIFSSNSPKFSYLIGPDSKLIGIATKIVPEKTRHRGILKEFGFI